MQEIDKPRLNIRALRESKGYTQEYMAEMLDISQSTYACLESGKTALSIKRLLQIADILETDFTALIDSKRSIAELSSPVPPSPAMLHDHSYRQTISVYEQLIGELKGEIDFLRSLIRTT